MSTQTYTLSSATGPVVEAPLLISTQTFSARYDLDRSSGIISREGHPLRGQSVADTIFIAPGVQGGVAAGWALLAMKGLGVGFAGLVFGDINPVMVQGAVTAGIPIAAGIDLAAFLELESGRMGRLDPSAGTLTVFDWGQSLRVLGVRTTSTTD